jgi:hypothetical protein
MVNAPTAGGVENRGGKFEDLFLLVFCAVIAIAGLVVPVWQLATGRFLSIDGLWLAGISLTLSAVFGGNLAWAVHTGEVDVILGRTHKAPSPSAAPEPPAAGSK